MGREIRKLVIGYAPSSGGLQSSRSTLCYEVSQPHKIYRPATFPIFDVFLNEMAFQLSSSVPTGQGKVWEICFFFKVREKSGNSVKWSWKLEKFQKPGNFKIIICLNAQKLNKQI